MTLETIQNGGKQTIPYLLFPEIFSNFDQLNKFFNIGKEILNQYPISRVLPSLTE